jgi:hypothetical protein
MRVMVFVKATADSEAGILPSPELITAMTDFNQQLIDAGIMVTGEGLKPSSAGKRVLFSGKNRTVTDGLVAGFWIWNVQSMEEAVEWVKKCPNPMPGDSEIEIRPFYELEDFGDALPPEIREREEKMKEQLESR